ncbi:radical SAM-associated putative lipoprotein [Butyricimonas synergistica]|mgnify:CR=1 FL=1|uniref:radical SAM-associated putative lipoprotein n=1 Tax=Butyricimonas synergistica TaxID=544644 RepID=UPI00036E7119|nr:radical SAM-associated putative lipoprotein [Butyricimonas synergistica]
MELSKNYWSKSWGWLLSSFLVVLGFTACDDDTGGECMYGSPTTTFSIKGKVQNEVGQALSGVRVVIPKCEFYQVATENFIPDQPIMTVEIRDTLYTDREGHFERVFYDFPADTVRYEMQFYDITPQPGIPPYEPDTLKVTFLRGDLKTSKDDGEWYRGHAEKEITVVLKEKKDE